MKQHFLVQHGRLMFISSKELESGVGARGEILEESFNSVVNLNDLEYLGRC